MNPENSRHTPGPWTIERGGGHAHNSIRGADAIQTDGWLGLRGEVSNASYSDRVCENLGDLTLPGPAANARLIAAAPEMLAALESVADLDGLTLIASPHEPDEVRKAYSLGAARAFAQAAAIAKTALPAPSSLGETK